MGHWSQDWTVPVFSLTFLIGLALDYDFFLFERVFEFRLEEKNLQNCRGRVLWRLCRQTIGANWGVLQLNSWSVITKPPHSLFSISEAATFYLHRKPSLIKPPFCMLPGVSRALETEKQYSWVFLQRVAPSLQLDLSLASPSWPWCWPLPLSSRKLDRPACFW